VKQKLVYSLSLCAGLVLSTGQADTVTLRSGEEYEGIVLRESDEEVVMRVQVSSSITDEMTFRKETIRAVVKTPVDSAAFQKLAAHEVAANSLTPEAYNLAIEACEDFQKTFPTSAHRQQVSNQIRSLKEEKARVARGEIKVAHQWYTPEEAKKERYQINAQLLLQQMNDWAARGDLVGALNLFDQLEKEYPGALAYPQSVTQALSIIQRLQGEIARWVPIARHRQKEFEEKVRFAVEPEKSRMIAAQKNSLVRSEAAFKQSTAKWKPFFAAMEESVTALKTTIDSETERLSSIKTEPMEKSVRLTEEGRELIRRRKPGEALARLQQAVAAWNANEAAPRLIQSGKELREALLAEEAAREKAAAEAARHKEIEAMEAQETPKKKSDVGRQAAGE